MAEPSPNGPASSGERRASWDSRYEGPHPVWRGSPALELDLAAGSRVLELGCGDGKTLRALVSAGHHAIGLDSSKSALLACGKRVPWGARAMLVRGDLVSLPFAPRSFDYVMAHHVFEHLYHGEREAASAEIARILRPSGQLDLKTFSVKDMRSGKGYEVEPGTFQREGIPNHYFTEDELLHLLRHLIPETVQTKVVEKSYHGTTQFRAVIRARFHSPP